MLLQVATVLVWDSVFGQFILGISVVSDFCQVYQLSIQLPFAIVIEQWPDVGDGSTWPAKSVQLVASVTTKICERYSLGISPVS